MYESVEDYDSDNEEDLDEDNNDDDDNDDDEEEEYDPNDDDPHPIEKIKRDGYHEYTYLEGVLYRLGNNNNDFELPVGVIEPTPENTFFPDQIDKYVEYIRDGGIIDTFPVRVSQLAHTLEEMLDFMDNEMLNDTYDDEIIDTLSLSFLHNITNLFEIYTEIGEGEEFYKYRRINKEARRIEDVFPVEDRTPEEIELLHALEHVFDFFEEHKEYTLNEMNHRFQAILRLGIKNVLVEPL